MIDSIDKIDRSTMPEDATHFRLENESFGFSWVKGDGKYHWSFRLPCWVYPSVQDKRPLHKISDHHPDLKSKQEATTMNKEQAIQQLAALQAEVDKLKAVIEAPEPKKQWEPSGGHWYIQGGGEVRPACHSARSYRLNGTEFVAKEEAEEAAKAYRVFHRLYKWVKDHDDGWKADWCNHAQPKYFVYFNNNRGSYTVGNHSTLATTGTVYMSEVAATKLAEALNSGEVVL